MDEIRSIDQSGIRSIVKDHFVDQANVVAVYLFGSVTGSRFNGQSDVDIGVVYAAGVVPDDREYLHTQMILDGLLCRDVDLIRLNHASPILRYQVLKYGERILNRQPSLTTQFIVRTLSEYFDLKQSRRIIERSLREVSIV